MTPKRTSEDVLVQTNDITEFPSFWFLCIFVRRPRGWMLVCCPHYRCLKYICDQPGIRVGFFVSSYSNFCRPPDRRKRQRGFIIVWLEDRASKRLRIG
jgi:hypothetical protein